MTQFRITSLFLLFFSFRVFCQLPTYHVDQYKLSKNKKAIKLKSLNQVFKISSNGYILYLDKQTFNSFLPIPDDKGKTEVDTVDLNPYYNIQSNKTLVEQAIYKTALTGKILVKDLIGNDISEKIYTCEYRDNVNTGYVTSGTSIYLKKSKTILLVAAIRNSSIVNFTD